MDGVWTDCHISDMDFRRHKVIAFNECVYKYLKKLNAPINR